MRIHSRPMHAIDASYCASPFLHSHALTHRNASMLRLTQISRQMLNHLNPWRRRPSGLHRPSAPAFRQGRRSAMRNSYLNPDDISGSSPMSHTIMKQCGHCMRLKAVPLSQRQHFHTCCEGFEMKERTTMAKISQTHMKLTRHVRQWDFVGMHPRCNVHRPASGATSKLPKK